MIKPVGVAEIVLAPGDVVFESKPARLRTLLGSCVAFTFWHPQRRIGGMCHFMLPERARKGQQLDGKYGDEALQILIRHALANGTLAEEYQVKLFGGGEMFPTKRQDPHVQNVADRNIDAALALTKKHHLKLTAQDLGSTGHRNIIFDLWNGNVWVRHQPMEALEKDAKQKNQRIAGR
ncbi:chemoreceptor glutamine deamidase CheD [Pseudomonas syringae]|uniref:chemoreceptor glutamine deamidase CheD n=1 Tax=Pseudomonas syringae TaxID=317 RepID=UPI0013730DBB|nr:chemoreceptor glutamine deamidase CheD [Pseudomonas syringae]MDU8432652.1 chemoreceptor glutamine deamidase CheD [Pseudomonas syringae pv. actinidifoliorum]MDU8523540.1 chemoreceptor glutamine deamidase CheD [Pseudomonas syringae pv. actinidifoliorum]MDU8529634.1 chemoreceptor glutamine deamidase CheD [Pseudomonas syringae pv. actinidifoliorum]NAS97371.1 chemotaxis protein CheD [Pseudomonas syringae pv. actinidifoliorum]NAT23853.1 chemotaxis protein CheD [Pseudomonas syringae pv. actinidifo